MFKLAKETNPDNKLMLNVAKTELLYKQLYELLANKLEQSEEEMIHHMCKRPNCCGNGSENNIEMGDGTL